MFEIIGLIIACILLLYVEIACIFAFVATNMLSSFKPASMLYLLMVATCGYNHFLIYTYMSENYDIQITTRNHVVTIK